MVASPVPLSLLDLAFIGPGQTPRDAFAACVKVAQRAEELGYRRVWYAEHHNMATIASSATSVLIEHVASKTTTIRVGAGGIMLPNHAPLVIAEQFGTLEALHPGRIDLGLGRAPGTDPVTTRALRRGLSSADTFPEDVLELQAYLAGDSRVAGVSATPVGARTSRSTSSARRCSGRSSRPRSACPTRSRRTSRRTRSPRRSRCTGVSFVPRRSSTSRTSSPG